MTPSFSLPVLKAARLGISVLKNERRSFREDAITWASLQKAPLRISGQEHLPTSGPGLITFNHYHRPGFQAWWLALLISALVPAEIHWVMTSAWTFSGKPFARPRMLVSRWFLARISRFYGFTSMPPMPPQPGEQAAGAAAVLALLDYAKKTRNPLIGFSPEGHDHPTGCLMWPPNGVGRLMLHLSRIGLPITPIGVYEREGTCCINIGRPFSLELADRLPAYLRDRPASEIVMRQIAELLPEELRGPFGLEKTAEFA